MIIKGSSRGQDARDTARLARHLMAAENETVSVVEIRGLVSMDLSGALEEARLPSLATRARKALYHASINLDRDEANLTTARWLEAADELERQLGMTGHSRVVVKHRKRDRDHLHCVWSRVHPQTLAVARDSHNFAKHEAVSRTLESRWGLRRVNGTFTRPKGSPRPVALATHDDQMAAERTGVPVAEVASILRRAWDSTTTAAAFRKAVAAEGLSLANGRRGIVVVDRAGTPHSIPRRLQLRAAEVNKRLAALNRAGLPTVDDAKKGTIPMPKTQQFGASRPRRRKAGAEVMPAALLFPDYWQKQGHEVEEFPTHLSVTLSPTTRLFDYGDRLVLDGPGLPTDAEIRALVAAGRERGWESIKFWGHPEFQHRASVIAQEMGFSADRITLECEEDKPKPLTLTAMPDHVRRRLLPAPDEPERTPAAPAPDAPALAPAPAFAP